MYTKLSLVGLLLASHVACRVAPNFERGIDQGDVDQLDFQSESYYYEDDTHSHFYRREVLAPKEAVGPKEFITDPEEFYGDDNEVGAQVVDDDDNDDVSELDPEVYDDEIHARSASDADPNAFNDAPAHGSVNGRGNTNDEIVVDYTRRSLDEDFSFRGAETGAQELESRDGLSSPDFFDFDTESDDDFYSLLASRQVDDLYDADDEDEEDSESDSSTLQKRKSSSQSQSKISLGSIGSVAKGLGSGLSGLTKKLPKPKVPSAVTNVFKKKKPDVSEIHGKDSDGKAKFANDQKPNPAAPKPKPPPVEKPEKGKKGMIDFLGKGADGKPKFPGDPKVPGVLGEKYKNKKLKKQGGSGSGSEGSGSGSGSESGGNKDGGSSGGSGSEGSGSGPGSGSGSSGGSGNRNNDVGGDQANDFVRKKPDHQPNDDDNDPDKGPSMHGANPDAGGGGSGRPGSGSGGVDGLPARPGPAPNKPLPPVPGGKSPQRGDAKPGEQRQHQQQAGDLHFNVDRHGNIQPQRGGSGSGSGGSGGGLGRSGAQRGRQGVPRINVQPPSPKEASPNDGNPPKVPPLPGKAGGLSPNDALHPNRVAKGGLVRGDDGRVTPKGKEGQEDGGSFKRRSVESMPQTVSVPGPVLPEVVAF